MYNILGSIVNTTIINYYYFRVPIGVLVNGLGKKKDTKRLQRNFTKSQTDYIVLKNDTEYSKQMVFYCLHDAQ